jgi:hypothetical protein
MTGKKEGPRRIRPEGEFSTCPECGYDGGFHNVFKGCGKGIEASWLMKCPNCKAEFDLGLKLQWPE